MSAFQYVEEFAEIFEEVERPGDFSMGGAIDPIVFPGLDIDGVGPIALPLLEVQAKDIISVCEQAPYGRKEETILDLNVRNTWQLDPSKFHLRNPQWESVMKTLEQKIQVGLGVVNCGIQCRLYKLLLYEKGSFFIPHRDTEKENRMFATLIIQLPSQYEGGTLIVKHKGATNSYDFSEESHYKAYFAAFYADCQHEVKPIERGYRLCLVYNVSYAESTLQAPQPADNAPLVNRLVELLRQWASDEEVEEEQFVYVLQHQYSMAGLTFADLKGKDLAVAELVKRAAEIVGMEYFLALLEIYETGSATGGCWGWEMDDYSDKEYFITYTITPDNKKSETRVGFTAESVIPKDALEELAYDKQEVEEATGNEGATIERWYHSAALVFRKPEKTEESEKESVEYPKTSSKEPIVISSDEEKPPKKKKRQ